MTHLPERSRRGLLATGLGLLAAANEISRPGVRPNRAALRYSAGTRGRKKRHRGNGGPARPACVIAGDPAECLVTEMAAEAERVGHFEFGGDAGAGGQDSLGVHVRPRCPTGIGQLSRDVECVTENNDSPSLR
jgi:hypothetical protein